MEELKEIVKRIVKRDWDFYPKAFCPFYPCDSVSYENCAECLWHLRQHHEQSTFRQKS